MILFKDIITGDEFFTDANKPIDFADCLGLIKVRCYMISESTGIDESSIGANASAEGGDEGCEDGVKSGIDVIMSCHLQATSFDKPTFITYMKPYVKKVLAKIECEKKKEEFKAQAQNIMKYLMKNLKDFDCYMGESCNPEGGLGFLGYEEDGMTPYLLFIKHGLIQEKQ